MTVTSLRLLIDIELVQHFAYRGNSHQLHDAAKHIIDIIWLYRSSIPVGTGEESSPYLLN